MAKQFVQFRKVLFLLLLIFTSALAQAGSVGKVTDINIERGLIEIDESAYRLLDTTKVTFRGSSRRGVISDIRQGQVVEVSISNESILTIEITPYTDVPM